MRSFVGIAAALALFTACGESSGGPDAKATVTETVTVTAEPSQVEKSAAITEVALGESLPTPWGQLTVLRVNPDVSTDLDVMRGLGDERWAAALVEACVDNEFKDEQVKLSWGPWSMRDATGGTGLSKFDTTGPRYPTPVYPQLGDRTTRPGTCVKGWITFSVTASAKLREVVYEGEAVPEPLVWTL